VWLFGSGLLGLFGVFTPSHRFGLKASVRSPRFYKLKEPHHALFESQGRGCSLPSRSAVTRSPKAAQTVTACAGRDGEAVRSGIFRRTARLLPRRLPTTCSMQAAETTISATNGNFKAYCGAAKAG